MSTVVYDNITTGDARISLHEAASLRIAAQKMHRCAQQKGWWDKPVPADALERKALLIALMHSELSEALEVLRAGNPPDDKVPELSGEAAELADVVIRIFDYAVAFQIDIGHAIMVKANFNLTRPKMHGGKKF